MNRIQTLEGCALPAKSSCVALGLFDGLHLGHQAVLQAAIETGARHELSPVCFTFSTGSHLPASKEGMTRLLSQERMGALLEEMGFSAMICPDFGEFQGLSPEAFVVQVLAQRLGASCLLCGYDFHFGRGAAAGIKELGELCQQHDITLEVVPAVLAEGEPISSRYIRQMITEGKVSQAARLLGRPFAIDFEVIQGQRLGRKLGAPTINQPFPQGFTLPRFGVYATMTRLGNRSYSSVTNVGIRPTVGSDCALAETFIQGFSGDLYHRRVEVEFLSFLRPEEKFSSLEELRRQIARDAEMAASIVAQQLPKEERTG